MDKLKLFWQTVIHMAKQVLLLPQTVANAVKQRRRQILLNEHEVERLDRIRNPSKYLGK
jgi:CO dehydrogenase/acetyl-CoA synthase epsilon subunit